MISGGNSRFLSNAILSAPPISFGGDHVALDIPNDGIQTGNGWEIKPLHKACVSAWKC